MHLFHFKVKSKIILPQPKLVAVSKQLSCLSLESFVLPSLITMKMVMLILELLVHTYQIGADKQGLAKPYGGLCQKKQTRNLEARRKILCCLTFSSYFLLFSSPLLRLPLGVLMLLGSLFDIPLYVTLEATVSLLLRTLNKR